MGTDATTTGNGIGRRALVRGAIWAIPATSVAMAAPAYAASTSVDGCLSVNLPVGSQSTLAWDDQWIEHLNPSQFVPDTGTLAGAPRSFSPAAGGRCEAGAGVRAVRGVTGAKVGERDPRVAGASFAYRRSLCIAPGTYRITYYAAAYRANPVTAYMRPTLTDEDGRTVATAPAAALQQNVTAHGFVDPQSGTGTNGAFTGTNMDRTEFGFTVTVTRNTTLTFNFTWSFGAIAADRANQGRLRRSGSNTCVPTFANDIAVEAPVIRRMS